MRKIILIFLLAIVSTYAQSTGELVSFKGKIANRNSDSIAIVSNNKVVKTIKLNKRGQFEEKFEIPATGLFQLFDGKESTLLFLKNGYALELNMDAKKFNESIVYNGNGATENNYLAKKALEDETFRKELDGFLTEEESSFTSLLEARKNATLSNLKSANVDESLVQVMTSMAQQEAMMLTQMYKQRQASSKLNGSPSPSFTFENHKGGMTKLEDFKGKYVYIDVWATWCAPCRAEIPHLKKLEEQFKGKNIVFVSISIDKKQDYDKWKKFVSEKQLGGVQLVADNDWNSKFVKDYGINGIPRFILIDPNGDIMFSDAERPSSPGLTSTLGEILN